MKRLIFASVLLATPTLALAQQSQYVPLNETLLHQVEQCETVATNQIVVMTKRTELTKSRSPI